MLDVSKAKTQYRCGECGGAAPKWTGWCDACGASGTMVEEKVTALRAASGGSAPPPARAIPLAETSVGVDKPVPTRLREVDRVLGGGLVPGSVTLLGGEPGIGKSTLLLQVAAATGLRCLYISAEESAQQVGARAERIGATAASVWLAPETVLPNVLTLLDEVKPELLVIDSIQALLDPELGSTPGSLAQVRGCSHALVAEAKQRGLTVVMVGHVTKDGGLAGPKVLEHVVDTVLAFEGERHHALRLLRASKHRFGGTHELGLFEMHDTGLAGVGDASSLFLADRQPGTPGSVVAPVLDGHRPLLVEVQALVMPSSAPFPRRTTQGIDTARLSQVLAVLEQRGGVPTSKSEVHVAVAGGVKVREPGVDLAMALAVASAATNSAVAQHVVACGEVGLGGELRQVQRTDRRLAEASRMGFLKGLVPRSAPNGVSGMKVVRCPSLRNALEAVLDVKGLSGFAN